MKLLLRSFGFRSQQTNASTIAPPVATKGRHLVVVPDPAPAIYIAGPMTGIPQFNFPAFESAAKRLRAAGHIVVSPAELDDPATRRAALASKDGAPGSGITNGETWGDFLARDVKLIADGNIQAIYVLPGWQHSRGARLETFIAHALCGKPIYRESGPRVRLWRLARAWVLGR